MTTVLRRLLALIPTLIGVSPLTFFLMRLAPGDPVKLMLGPEATPEAIEAMRRKLGYDKPLLIQYLHYTGQVARGEFGQSITSKRPVAAELFSRLPATAELAFAAMLFALITGVAVGALSAVYPRSALDFSARLLVFIFLAMPGFWLGLELIILFSRTLEILPPAGRGRPWTPETLTHLALPAITLGVGTGAFLCRILRSSLLQTLGMDYIRTARAKGLSERRVILKHAMKNALIPFLMVAGLSTGALLGGSVIIETVFDWPGIGKLLVESILERDFPVTMGCTLLFATLFTLVNLLVDLSYIILDPRIRLEGGERA